MKNSKLLKVTANLKQKIIEKFNQTTVLQVGTSGLTLLNWIVWFLCLSSVFFYYFSEELISSFFHLNKKVF